MTPKASFALDDRQPGMRRYVLRLYYTTEEDGTWIEFGRPGHEDQMRIKLRQLFALRARQALDEGDAVDIEGRRFLVLGQAGPGPTGSLLFFPGDLEERMGARDNYEMAPSLMAETVRAVPNGGIQRIEGKLPLGWVAGRFYYLIYDEALGYWVPVL